MMESHRSFPDILDECLDRVLTMGEPVEACLDDYPEHAGELRGALLTAGALRAAAVSVQPDMDRKRASRQRFLEALERQQRRAAPVRPGLLGMLLGSWPRLAATVAVAVLAILGTGTGTVMASQSTVPGDTLYPVKRAVEQTQLTLASSDREAELHATLMERRVDELEAVTERDREQFVPHLVEEIDRHSERARTLTAAPVEPFIPPADSTPEPTPGPGEPTPTPGRQGQSVSVSPVLTLTVRIEQAESRVEDLIEKAQDRDPRVQDKLREVKENLGQTKKRLRDLLEHVDRSLPQRPTPEPHGASVDGGSSATPTRQRPAPTPPGEDPGPERRNVQVHGVITDVRIVHRGGEGSIDIRLRLDNGSTVEVHVGRNSRTAVGDDAARLADFTPGARVEAVVSRETREVRSLSILPTQRPGHDERPTPEPTVGPALHTPTATPRPAQTLRPTATPAPRVTVPSVDIMQVEGVIEAVHAVRQGSQTRIALTLRRDDNSSVDIYVAANSAIVDGVDRLGDRSIGARVQARVHRETHELLDFTIQSLPTVTPAPTPAATPTLDGSGEDRSHDVTPTPTPTPAGGNS